VRVALPLGVVDAQPLALGAAEELDAPLPLAA